MGKPIVDEQREILDSLVEELQGKIENLEVENQALKSDLLRLQGLKINS